METINVEVAPYWDESMVRLKECLRGELSAVETYDLALTSTHDNDLTEILLALRNSHDRRVTLLRSELKASGYDPPENSGGWGVIAKTVQAGADLLGDRWAIAALVEGEDRGVKLYSENLDDCVPVVRDFIERHLLPEQRRTCNMCRSIRRLVEGPEGSS
jgi:Domain of unknown function (DUF2383)